MADARDKQHLQTVAEARVLHFRVFIIKDSKYKDISSLDKVISGEMTIEEVKSWYVNLVREKTGSLEKAANKINVCYSTAQKWSKNG